MIEKKIKNPFKVNHRMYILISGCSVLGIIICSFHLLFCREWLFDIIKNISYGCFASTIVAWLLEVCNVRDKNHKANSVYDAVYSDLHFKIEYYIETWARICTIAYKGNIRAEETHTWLEWYELSKELFYKCDEKRKKEIMSFFVDQLQYAVDEANKAIQRITAQTYVLTINDVYNREMERIIKDYRFEFYAADLELKHDNSYDEFWKMMDAIQADMKKYINAWVDIRFYNSVRFKSHGFFKDKHEIARAVLETRHSDA